MDLPTAPHHAPDVLVIGGGAAGLSAALTLGRARRSVLVVDGGEHRNAPAAGVHAFLTRDGTSPADLVAMGREEVRRYGGEVIDDRVDAVAPDGDSGFVATLSSGDPVRARRLLLATGVVDRLPDVAGLQERWGRDVLHCPYCHGWEVRDQPIGVLGSDGFAAHMALLFRQWSPDVVLFLHTAPEPTAEEAEQLEARGIAIVRGEVEGIEVTDDALTGVRLAGGEVVARRALAVRTRTEARGALLDHLGVPVTEHPSGAGTFVESDALGSTAVPGVWVAGNLAEPFAQVMASAAAGSMAAAAINLDLIADDARVAVEARRAARAG